MLESFARYTVGPHREAICRLSGYENVEGRVHDTHSSADLLLVGFGRLTNAAAHYMAHFAEHLHRGLWRQGKRHNRRHQGLCCGYRRGRKDWGGTAARRWHLSLERNAAPSKRRASVFDRWRPEHQTP